MCLLWRPTLGDDAEFADKLFLFVFYPHIVFTIKLFFYLRVHFLVFCRFLLLIFSLLERSKTREFAETSLILNLHTRMPQTPFVPPIWRILNLSTQTDVAKKEKLLNMQNSNCFREGPFPPDLGLKSVGTIFFLLLLITIIITTFLIKAILGMQGILEAAAFGFSWNSDVATQHDNHHHHFCLHQHQTLMHSTQDIKLLPASVLGPKFGLPFIWGVWISIRIPQKWRLHLWTGPKT